MTPENHAQNRFETALLIYNPKSESSIERSAAVFKKLLPLVPNIDTKASESELGENLSILSAQDKSEKNLIISIGGDGLANDIATAMMVSPNEIDSKSTLIPSRSGHANDWSKSLFYKGDRDDIEKIVTSGTFVDIYPLTGTVKTPDENIVICKIALSYLSVGSSSEISDIVNQPEYRAVRYSKTRLGQRIADIRLGMHVMNKEQEYRMTRADETSILTDYYLVNGPSIAGIFPIRGNIITKNGAVRLMVKPGGTYTQIGKAAIGNVDRVDSSYEEMLVVESDHSIYLQYDGNTLPIMSGSSIDFGISKTPIQTITTRKKNIAS